MLTTTNGNFFFTSSFTFALISFEMLLGRRNNEHFLNIYYVPGILVNILHIVYRLNLTRTLWSRFYKRPHFIEQKTESPTLSDLFGMLQLESGSLGWEAALALTTQYYNVVKSQSTCVFLSSRLAVFISFLLIWNVFQSILNTWMSPW